MNWKEWGKRDYPFANDHEANVTFDIRGFMNTDQIASCDEMCDFWITKPGGSTVGRGGTECRKLKSHPWEFSNCRYLKRTGLGSRLRKSSSLASQFDALLSYGEDR